MRWICLTLIFINLSASAAGLSNLFKQNNPTSPPPPSHTNTPQPPRSPVVTPPIQSQPAQQNTRQQTPPTAAPKVAKPTQTVPAQNSTQSTTRLNKDKSTSEKICISPTDSTCKR